MLHHISRPPSRVLIHEDCSDVWIPQTVGDIGNVPSEKPLNYHLQDIATPQDTTQASNDKSGDHSNTSFPLSDSEIPETFDTCADLSDMNHYSVDLIPQILSSSESTKPLGNFQNSVDTNDISDYFVNLNPLNLGEDIGVRIQSITFYVY